MLAATYHPTNCPHAPLLSKLQQSANNNGKESIKRRKTKKVEKKSGDLVIAKRWK